METKHLNQTQLAHRWGISPRTLERWRWVKQPGPIQRIARDAADDGLLQRFMFAVPSTHDRGVDARPDQNAAMRYDRLFPALALMRPMQDIATGVPQTIVLA